MRKALAAGMALLAALCASASPARGEVGGRECLGAVPAVPYDAEVEYIESTGEGTPYIDIPTAAIVGQYYGIRGYVRVTDTGQKDGRYFDAPLWLEFTFAPYGDNVNPKLCSTNIGLKSAQGGIWVVKDELSWFEISTAGTSRVPDLPRSLRYNFSTIRFFNWASGQLRRQPVGFGRVEIISGTRLEHSLVPVRFTNEEGEWEGAWYDEVSGEMFRNQGTGAFAIGPDL